MPTRRQFIRQVSVASSLGLIASTGLLPLRAFAARDADWFMPDEGEPQRHAFVAFGAQDAIWEDFTADVQAALGRIVKAIARFQPVTVLCREDERDLAEELCGSANTRFLLTELDDIWMRDIGANFVITEDGDLGAVDFNFNGWGNKQRHADDARIARLLAQESGARYLRSELVGEGGAIEVDGHGTGIMTESCWVNGNRNPGWSVPGYATVDLMAEYRIQPGMSVRANLINAANRYYADALYSGHYVPGVGRMLQVSLNAKF